MFNFECHGTYLRDFATAGDVRRIMEISETDADEAMSASPFLRAAEVWDTRHGLLLNKGFTVVGVGDDGRCAIVANHDGRYSLHSGAWPFFAEKYGLAHE